METIGSTTIMSYLAGHETVRSVKNSEVREDAGHLVKSYLELAKKIAELQFLNRDYVLLFRGQARDHRNRSKNSSLKASILRGDESGNPESWLLEQRFDRLERAERELVRQYDYPGRDRVNRYRVVRWSILQHYEVCATPLLDVTQSLRIAASFASSGEGDQAYVFVLGVPNISGAITASAEAGIQIVRLSSVCPPIAVRPHVQEGYLLGEYPELNDYSQKQMYAHHEVDFGRRLVAKFRFKPTGFWRAKDFPRIHPKALYPTSRSDPFARTAKAIARQIDG